MTTEKPLLDTLVPAAPVRARAGVLQAVPATIVMAPTIALSAFLLFSVEPLVGRLMLPAFGGAPGVWATVLAFFQAVLLLGYLYGHTLVTRVGVRRGAILHLVVAGVAIGALAVSPVRVADVRLEAVAPAIELLLVLAMAIGLPAFVLTATTPVLSAWYDAVQSADRRPRDPYWLYALSNAGSLAALLVYPFLIEPRIGLTVQREAWTAGFVALVGLIALAAAVVRTRSPDGANGPAAGTAALDFEVAGRAIDARRRFRWILLAAVPSGLLAAVTNMIATDLISAPLLWVGPLAIYLLSFIIAFSPRGRRFVPGLAWLAPVAVTLLWVPFGSGAGWPILPLLALEYSAFAVVATALHGRLAMDRPGPARLTEFYLTMALGGALGGGFVALVAPLAFDGIWEFPILLVAGLVALALSESAPGSRQSARRSVATTPTRGGGRARDLDLAPFFAGAPARIAAYVAVAIPLALALAASGSIGLEAGVRWLLVGGLVLLVGGRLRFLAVATALVLVLGTFVLPRDVLFRDRSFFGVTEVLRPADGTRTELMNGTTLHGVQSTDPDLRDLPGSYYSRGGPIGDVFAVMDGSSAPGSTSVPARAGTPSAFAPRSIGLVGLGAGALATYRRLDDDVTFYEIDPVVVAVASDPSYFTYLSDAAVRPKIVLGDARLTLADVPDGTHDVLVLDAFSSDTIPVHLLTVEAFREYERVLRPGGLLAVHVSNRYYDLAPAVAAAADRVGMTSLARSHDPEPAERALGATPSIWVVASEVPASLAPFPERGWDEIPIAEPLTDDFADVLRFLRPVGW